MELLLEVLNSSKSYRGIWILQKWVTRHEKFKIYKEFHYKLYLKPEGAADVSEAVLYKVHTERAEDQELIEKQHLSDKWFLSEFLKWFVHEGKLYLKDGC